MRTPFRALLWKEIMEGWQAAVIVLVLMVAWFYWTVLPSVGSVGNLSDPAAPLPFLFLLGVIAGAIGYRQAGREARGDMWTFALHRPASGGAVFAAKVIVGAATLLVGAGIPWWLATWWLSLPGHRPVPFDRSIWLAGIADLACAIMWYAAGVCAASRRRKTVTRAAGFLVALLGWTVVASVSHFAAAIMGALTFIAVLALAAWADFVSGSDFEAQPLWGRAASSFVAIAGVVMVVAFTRSVNVPRSGGVTTDTIWGGGPSRLTAFVGNDGRILALRGKVPHQSVDGVITSGQLTTDPDSAKPMERIRYRDSERWVRRLFPSVDGPVWYYERRNRLISIYDDRTYMLRGWLGPDGYSEGPEMPATRFPGYLMNERVSEMRHDGFLILSGGVYLLDELERPQLIFTAPEGETILTAEKSYLTSGMTPENAGWSWFNAVTTTRATYVIGKDGAIQVRAPHPQEVSQRRVRVYRAPYSAGAATFLWYEPPADSVRDPRHYVLEYRQGIEGPVNRHRFKAMQYGALIQSPRNPPPTISLWSPFAFMPAVHVWSLSLPMTAVDRVKAYRRVAIWLFIGLVGAGLVLWLSWKYRLPTARAIAWASLTAVIGPVVPVAMWLLLEWPHRAVKARG